MRGYRPCDNIAVDIHISYTQRVLGSTHCFRCEYKVAIGGIWLVPVMVLYRVCALHIVMVMKLYLQSFVFYLDLTHPYVEALVRWYKVHG
jgi:hypothetical protein